MTEKPTNSRKLEAQILQLTKDENPKDVQQLANIARKNLGISEKEALNLITQLVNEDKIRLTPQPQPQPQTLSRYFLSIEAHWFWITVILTTATTITVFTIPEDAFPLVYIRYVLGAAFVLWLPGYTFIKALFPAKKDLDTIERVALSIGLSLALVPIVGLLLNYTPWGIRLTPITLSLTALTLTCATVAVAREHYNQAKTE